MAQDFAKKRAVPDARRRPGAAATRTEPEGSASHWSWFFSGLFCGFLIIGIAYLGIVQLDTGAQTTEPTLAGGDAASNRPTFDFGFYNELENAEIAVATPPPPAPPQPAASNVANSSERSAAETVVEQASTPAELTRYLLQAGSFQTRQDAESRRARIILLNMNATIAPGVVSGRTWHRVQVGPFNGRAAVDAARDLLTENNIESYLLLMRD